MQREKNNSLSFHFREVSKTQSLCPVTKKPTPAQVIENENGVFLKKQSYKDDVSIVQIEKDPVFYHAFADPTPVGQLRAANVYFYVTSRCNLNCPVCYEANRGPVEPPLESMRAALASMHRQFILLCGAEPTCRPELPQIISMTNKRNTAFLLTNGIRIAELDYLQELHQAGLRYVILAFNGLNDEVYQRINGKPLLQTKLKALKNIKTLGMEAFLSMTIVRGINEDQILPVGKFYMDRPFIRQVRYRAMAPIGSFVSSERIYMSELLNMVCDALGIDQKRAIKHLQFMDELGKSLKKDYLRPRLCAMKIDFDQNMIPLASDIEIDSINHGPFQAYRLLMQAVRAWGSDYVFRQMLNRIGKHRYIDPKDKYRISLRVWPDHETMDLKMNSRCMGAYWRNGEFSPFCLCNAMRTD